MRQGSVSLTVSLTVLLSLAMPGAVMAQESIRFHGPMVSIAPDQKAVEGWVLPSIYQQTYKTSVAPGGELRVRLHHVYEGQFHVSMEDRWGRRHAPGLWQNRIPTGNPEAVFKNPKQDWQVIFISVGDSELFSSERSPYRLDLTRSWDPALLPPPGVEGL